MCILIIWIHVSLKKSIIHSFLKAQPSSSQHEPFLQTMKGYVASCFSSTGLLYVGFSACMFGLYSFMPVVIKKTSATAVNLSLLTADLYSLFCGLFLFHYKVCGNEWCIGVIAVCLKNHQCRTNKRSLQALLDLHSKSADFFYTSGFPRQNQFYFMISSF